MPTRLWRRSLVIELSTQHGFRLDENVIREALSRTVGEKWE